MSTYIERFYYTLGDYLQTPAMATLSAFLTAHSFGDVLVLDNNFATSWMLIAKKYWKWSVDFEDVEFDGYDTPTKPEITDEMKLDFSRQFQAIYQGSAPRYLKLLSLYASQADKLTAQLATTQTTNTTGTHRTNDTPQNGGEFTTDAHTSAYDNTTGNGTVTTNSDVTTAMGRLAEIQQNYRNLAEDWANEFAVLFDPEE